MKQSWIKEKNGHACLCWTHRFCYTSGAKLIKIHDLKISKSFKNVIFVFGRAIKAPIICH